MSTNGVGFLFLSSTNCTSGFLYWIGGNSSLINFLRRGREEALSTDRSRHSFAYRMPLLWDPCVLYVKVTTFMLSLKCSLPLDRSSSRFTNANVGRSLAMPRPRSLIRGVCSICSPPTKMYAVSIAIALLYNTAVCATTEESCSADGIKECSGQNLSVLNGKNVKSHISLYC